MKIAPEDVESFRFTVVRGAKPGASVSFGGGLRTIRIGRAVDCDIVLNDPTASRQHARVEIRQDGWFLVDAGSSAGVEKLGFRIGTAPEPLESGDEFKLGDTILRFEVIAKKGTLKKTAAAEAAAATNKAAGPSLFDRVGLKTQQSRLLVGAIVILVFGYLLWPSAPGLPEQATGPVGFNYAAYFGWIAGGDHSHLDSATFEVPVETAGFALYFDVVSAKGVEVRVTDRPVGKIEASSQWQSFVLLVIPRAFGTASKIPVTFDNLGYDKSQGDIDPSTAPYWALRKTFYLRSLNSTTSPAATAEELQGSESLADRITDNVAFRAAIAQTLRNASLGAMKLSGKSAMLIPIPSGKQVPPDTLAQRIDTARTELVAESYEPALRDLTVALARADGELAREYQKNMNTLSLARKREAVNDQSILLATMIRMFPDITDPRRRVHVPDVKKLRGDPLKVYNATYERLGVGFSG